MAGKSTRNAYVEKLREFGFVPCSEALSPEEEREIVAMVESVVGEGNGSLVMPPEKIARLVTQGEPPAFARIGGETWAMDDRGIEWIATGTIDLSPFGFSDNIAWLKEKNARAH